MILGEDYGESSSTIRERTRAFAMWAMFWKPAASRSVARPANLSTLRDRPGLRSSLCAAPN